MARSPPSCATSSSHPGQDLAFSIEREETADGIVADEQRAFDATRAPSIESSRKARRAGAEDAQPAAVDEDAAGLVRDAAHR